MATGPVKPTNTMNPLTGPTAADSAKKAERVADGAKTKAASTPPRGGNYDVQISTEAKERAEFKQKLFEAAKSQPAIREDRVAELKKQIQEGSYQIDTGKIADGMMREAIMEHLASTEK